MRIALSVSFCATALIFVFWFMSFYGTRNKDQEAVIVEKTTSPVSSLMASTGAAFKDIGEEFSKLKQKIGGLFSETYVVPEVPKEGATF